MVEHGEMVSELLAKLDDLRITDNTIVIKTFRRLNWRRGLILFVQAALHRVRVLLHDSHLRLQNHYVAATVTIPIV